jgi:hypothetical protein
LEVGWRPASGIAAHISQLDWGVLKTTPMANSSEEYFNSSLILRLWKLELER